MRVAAGARHGDSRASKTVSATLSGGGQLLLAASNRRMVSGTLEGGCPDSPRNLTAWQPGRLHPDHISHMAHREPLRPHPGSFAKPKGTTLWEPEETSSPRRHHLGIMGGIVSERVGAYRNDARDHLGVVADIERNLHLTPVSSTEQRQQVVDQQLG